ncbi:endo-1,4-beta-xylanase [Bythopirellula polymerisocia]|uniref:endo-1,4-beta-xylanase n=1 Tax=Bythopirellula polymerisocia TaxID=2528003 RepID=UPI001E48C76C|nr:endo-1,4-beta-xylanase [Bythopirellula polymerisocia]
MTHRDQKLAVFFVTVSLLMGSVVHGVESITLPQGGEDAIEFSQDESLQLRKINVEASGEWISIEGMPFEQAYQVESGTRYCDAKNIQVFVPIRKTIRKGDVLLISFWMRRPNAGGQPNNAYFSVNAGPNTPGYVYKLSAYREWKQHVRSFVAPLDYDLTNSSIRIDLGEAGTVAEVADLRLVNYGPHCDPTTLPRSTVNYPGRAADAAWRKEALKRIENIRKGDIAIRVVDAQGDPVANASVTITMQKHAFGFGSAVNSEVLGADKSEFPIQPKRKVTVTWEDAQKYREIVKKYFDRVTFESELRPGNWKLMKSGDPQWSRKHRILMEKTLPWLKANGIAARGHYIGWAPMDFNEVEKRFLGDPEGHRAWLWEHMADVLPKTSEFVTEWDTINHIVGWGKHTYEIEYGGPEIYSEILAEARRLAPDATHAINEGKVLPDGYKREPYKRIIRFLDEQGQAPDIVGFMGHFDLSTLTPPEELLEVYDDFAKIAPRLQLSEFDVEAGDDEALQADYYRDVMIATFSHPNFEAIVQWGFWERMHWKPAAAMWREDWTVKPCGKVFVDLVANQWWTNQTLTTDPQGECQLRGFLGDYSVIVKHEGKTTKEKTVLNREGTQILVQLE